MALKWIYKRYELFSCYMSLGQHATASNGAIETTRTALRLLNLHQNKSERAVIFSDPKVAILSAGSTETVISTEAKDCQVLVRQLKAKHKQIDCRGFRDTVKSQRMNMPMYWPKRVPKLHKHIPEKHPTILLNYI
jgi:hypothetical protein